MCVDLDVQPGRTYLSTSSLSFCDALRDELQVIVPGVDRPKRVLRVLRGRNLAHFPTGLLERVLAFFERRNIAYRIKYDGRQPYHKLSHLNYAKVLVPNGIRVLDHVPLPVRFQVMGASLIDLGKRTLWIAPSNEIVAQTAAILNRNKAGVAYHLQESSQAKKLHGDKRIVCMTVEMAYKVHASFYQTRKCLMIYDWICPLPQRDFNTWVIATRVFFRVLQNCLHIGYRYGLVGPVCQKNVSALETLVGGTFKPIWW